jgi:hypothetical protein
LLNTNVNCQNRYGAFIHYYLKSCAKYHTIVLGDTFSTNSHPCSSCTAWIGNRRGTCWNRRK